MFADGPCSYVDRKYPAGPKLQALLTANGGEDAAAPE